ncbi:MAG: hydroxymethylbilane synthase [Verrucomicrobia bacterium]|jgi:hydroxymethylbilane synthase|nr:hydroxymethylbilane synthase [Verrucomicrobiota bacterium]
MPNPILIATRGSALALAQANAVLHQCRQAFPDQSFELVIIKTTGDKLQTASMAKGDLPKGLFTKELEVALLNRQADLAVHSLKDLPTELPPGLQLGAVGRREDVRDVLIYRDAAHSRNQPAKRGFAPNLLLADFPPEATIATSSTRRQAQLLAARPDLKVVEIRGNVSTRMQKLADRAEMDGTILAMAGLKRLNFRITDKGRLEGDAVPPGLLAVLLDVETMLPCVGQAAVGIEIRQSDERMDGLCARLNHAPTFQCVTAERSFLAAMGGGCQSPVGAHAEIIEDRLRLRAVSFIRGCRRAEATRAIHEAVMLGTDVAAALS